MSEKKSGKSGTGTEQDDLNYISSIMAKAEISFRDGCKFFLVISLYFLVSNLLRRFQLFGKIVRNDSFRTVIKMKGLELVLFVLLLIPLFIILAAFRKSATRRKEGMGKWLYEICAFTIIACTVMPAFILLPSVNENVSGDIFSLAGVCICMFACGQFLQKKSMIRTAIVYFTFICILLLAFCFGLLYLETNTDGTLFRFVSPMSYGLSLLNILSAPVGYFILSMELCKFGRRKIGKG